MNTKDTLSKTMTKMNSNDPKGLIPVIDDLSMEKVLSPLTTIFPFFVLSAAIVGMKFPQTMLWVNQGQHVPLMLV